MLPPVLTDLKDRHDPWVIQLGSSFRFALESLDFLFPGQLAGQDHLQCDDTVETRLSCFENDTHATPSDLLMQFVVTEVANTLTDGWLN